jgi:carboxypeptidase Taq
MSEPGAGRTAYEALRRDLRETAVIASAGAVLAWDQETQLPTRGSALRADQLASLSGIVHERRTRPQVEEWLAVAEADAELRSDPAVRANLRELRRDYDRAVKLPASLVRELAQTAALAQRAWRDAREASDFGSFAPWLEKTLELARAKAACYRPGEPRAAYDALLDEYEPDATAGPLERLFGELRGRLAPLIAEIVEARPPSAGPLDGLRVPVARQIEFNRVVASSIGFDFEAGRLDVSTHPFCEGIGPGDTRLTTRFREDHFLDALSSTMHEAGHGLYEQGLPKEQHLGEPLGESTSLGIHESQSRMWENLVGRSRAFWTWALPEARRALHSDLGGASVDDLFRAVNRVEPGLIRVDSDEATYNLHVLLRFDLERAMLRGDLAVADLPEAWNARIRSDLGLDVPDDRRGCLQDIHWSMGAIGYFPTYTLGNLYAAQLWEAARKQLPDLDEAIGRGEFGGLLGWLREHVHRHGRQYSALELCRRATGEELSVEPFFRYLEGKLRGMV